MLLTDLIISAMIAILALYVICMWLVKKFNKTDITLCIMTLLILVCVYLFYMNKMYCNKQGFTAPVNYSVKNIFKGMNVLNNKTNNFPYDNLSESELLNAVVEHNPEDGVLTSPNKVNYMEHKLVNPVYHSPVGTPHYLKLDPNQNDMKPSVDGQKDGLRSLAMFAYNVFKPECCPSSYSGDRGCVCMSKEQKEYLNRGGSVV